MPKLTKSYVDRLTPPTNGKYAIEWDDGVKGFGVRIMPSGRRTYFYQARARGQDKITKITIGVHGDVTADEARDAAEEYRKLLRKGIDPIAAEKAKAAAEITVLQVMNDYFRDRDLKPSSRRSIEGHVTKTALAPWKDTPIASLTVGMISKRYHEYRTKGFNGKPAPHHAQQAFGTLRALINYAMREYRGPDGKRIITENAAEEALYKKTSQPQARTRRIPDDRVGAVWNALWGWRTTAHNEDTLSSVDLVIFLLLTGARRGEASSLAWRNVNLDEGWWHISDPKNKNQIWLPLSSEAKRLLELRLEHKVNDYVFPTRRSKEGHIGDPRAIMERVSDVACTVISPHDLRRTWSNLAVNACGVPLHRAELLTNHVPKSVTGLHYLERQKLQPLHPEVQKVADWIVEQARLDREKAAKS